MTSRVSVSISYVFIRLCIFFFQAEDGIRDRHVTGVQTCALPISHGTTRYTDRFPQYRDSAFYRTVMGLQVSSLGIGTYLGSDDQAADDSYTDALIAAGENGINFFDEIGRASCRERV